VQSFKGSEGGNVLPSTAAADTGGTKTADSGEATITPIGATGSDTPPVAAEAGTKIGIELGEQPGGKLYLATEQETVGAGTVTFEVENTGAMPHELVVLRTDVAADKLPMAEGGVAKEDGRVGGVEQMAPGSEPMYLTMDLEPGAYVLLCNVPGHYGLGQYAAFTVT
jgi:uncharacterized cupredoxin-like copper-binding protein